MGWGGQIGSAARQTVHDWVGERGWFVWGVDAWEGEWVVCDGSEGVGDGFSGLRGEMRERAQMSMGCEMGSGERG